MPAPDEALRNAARIGSFTGVQAALSAGANVHANNDLALRTAALNGYLEVVRCLLDAGADIHELDGAALRWAAVQGHVAVVRVLLEYGALVFHATLTRMGGLQPAVQMALVEAGNIAGLSATDMARKGGCPSALCALLARQGYSEVSAMLEAMQLLEPLEPEARADLLTDLLAQYTQPEIPHVSPV